MENGNIRYKEALAEINIDMSPASEGQNQWTLNQGSDYDSVS